MRQTCALVVGAMLVVTGCGGSDTSFGSPVPEATIAPAPTATPTPTEPPEELPLVDLDIRFASDTGVVAAPGESVVIDHVVHNTASTPRTVRFRVQDAEVAVELSLSSFRLDAGGSLPVVTTVNVPPDAAPGQVYSFDVAAVQADDVSRRVVNEIRVLVDDAEGERPTVPDTFADTETNEKVIVYVLGPVSDVDDDLDTTSLRLLGGGFVAADVVASPEGTITYYPFANVVGEDVVLYEFCDDEGRCDSAMLTIDVHDH